MTSCASCAIGMASRVGHGGYCPFVARKRVAGERVYLEGQRGTGVWLVKQGRVALVRQANGGDVEQVRAVRGAGALIGLEILVRDGYLDTACTLGDATLCALPRDDLEGWLAESGHARVLLDETLRGQAGDALRGSGADGNSSSRVARWLLDEAAGGVAPPVPRRMVASMLGMVPETFSRALAGLAKDGAIELTRRTLRVRDRDALLRLAGRD